MDTRMDPAVIVDHLECETETLSTEEIILRNGGKRNIKLTGLVSTLGWSALEDSKEQHVFSFFN